jgi:hypothetical protein
MQLILTCIDINQMHELARYESTHPRCQSNMIHEHISHISLKIHSKHQIWKIDILTYLLSFLVNYLNFYVNELYTHIPYDMLVVYWYAAKKIMFFILVV